MRRSVLHSLISGSRNSRSPEDIAAHIVMLAHWSGTFSVVLFPVTFSPHQGVLAKLKHVLSPKMDMWGVRLASGSIHTPLHLLASFPLLPAISQKLNPNTFI